MDSGLEPELAAVRQLSDPEGHAPGGVDGTYPGGIGRGESEYARTWEDAASPDDDVDDGPAPQSDSQGWPVEALDEDGETVTVWLCQKHSDNGTVYFTTSDGEQYCQPRLAGGLYVKRSTVENAFPGATLRVAIERYLLPAAQRDRS